MKIVIEVPATTSNLGPAFDAVGMALELCNTVRCETGGEGLELELIGKGRGELPEDETNLVVRTMDAVFAECRQVRPPMRLTLHNRIPLAGGLGGSAAATVAGALLANELLGGGLGRRDEVLDYVAAREGHPDNVAPCMLGGFVAAEFDGRLVRAVRLDPPLDLGVVLAIPALRLATDAQRAVLPKTIPFADAVSNVTHTALLVAAMARGRLDLLGAAMTDRLHQAARARNLPGFDAVVEDALGEGALACVLSGSGATVAAFTDRRQRRDDAVGQAMQRAFGAHGVASTIKVTRPRAKGAVVR